IAASPADHQRVAVSRLIDREARHVIVVHWAARHPAAANFAAPEGLCDALGGHCTPPAPLRAKVSRPPSSVHGNIGTPLAASSSATRRFPEVVPCIISTTVPRRHGRATL